MRFARLHRKTAGGADQRHVSTRYEINEHVMPPACPVRSTQKWRLYTLVCFPPKADLHSRAGIPFGGKQRHSPAVGSAATDVIQSHTSVDVCSYARHAHRQESRSIQLAQLRLVLETALDA